jgi:hypothetical protein
MRVEVLKYLEENQLMQEMREEERTEIIDELNTLHNRCADTLFKITQDMTFGKLVSETMQLKLLFEEIEHFRGSIDLVRIEARAL